MSAVAKLVTNLAGRLDLGEDNAVELSNILKNTAFKTRDTVSDSQMAALLIVANNYGLNPFTRELFAYPDKSNGIVPVVSVDGWARIINSHDQIDGIEFNYSETTLNHKGKTCHEWIECAIYRKDRSRPIVIRERFEEVVRSVNFPTPWDTHPSRMHRHKTLIQCARVAFGFAGIYDQDEAERLVEKDMGYVSEPSTQEDRPAKQLEPYPDSQLEQHIQAWGELISSEKKTAEDIIKMVSTKHSLSDEQKKKIRDLEITEAEVTHEPS